MEKSTAPPPDGLLPLLKASFGFASFRPLQHEIISDVLSGHDVFALLPTGAGKSLCYQLPALARPGLTLVVSPLIALMKDQVDALTLAGVPATCLNSSLEPGEGRERMDGLNQGKYRLLYAAPERVLLDGFLRGLQRWNVTLLAIDEAHCVSEWGHDFRPEYRRLAELREILPNVPMLAMTATATERVRQDIVAGLSLREPRRYQASFDRPNLNYTVTPKAGAYAQTLAFLRSRPEDSGIIYCASRKGAEGLAKKLRKDGIGAKPYHAGLTPDMRSRNQERFLKDKTRVICATIAFGMGIDKPNVRFVLHYDLPKSLEGYYQETGRAGRDGLPADCLLLFSAGDAVKQRIFIEEKTDAQEIEAAHAQLRKMVEYAETPGCRRAALLAYFGEKREGNCGSCDGCLAPRAVFDGTVAAQKLLSTVYRVKERSGFSVGLNHIVEVLTGAKTEKLIRWGHNSLSTYGIGSEHSKAQWQGIGRELVRLGFLVQADGKFSTLELSALGRGALRDRTPITLTKPAEEKLSSRHDTSVGDEKVYESLRRLRQRLARQRGLPPYMVFGDASLRQMARDLPSSTDEFSRISGVGDKKLREFGSLFLAEIAASRA